jgi:hypothetical protein
MKYSLWLAIVLAFCPTIVSEQVENESLRRILEAVTEQVPGYSVSFSSGVADVFSARGREDPSNLLNTVIKNFEVSELDTDRTDMELFCALSHELMPSGGCGGSHPVGQWGRSSLRFTCRTPRSMKF